MRLKPRLLRKPRKGHWATKGLVGLWLCNEGDNKVFDLSKSHHGTLLNSAAWSTGKFGSGLVFPGGTSQCDLGINAYDLGIRRKGTFAAWINADDITPGADMAIISDWNSNVGMNLYIDNSPAGELAMYVYPDNYRVESGVLIHEGWNFVVGVMTGTAVELYQDGIFTGTAALGGDVGDSASTLKIGIRGDSSIVSDFAGKIDLLTIWNRDLSASEIAQLYREPFIMFERDPIELWVAATSVGVAPSANPKGPLGHPLYGALAGPISF